MTFILVRSPDSCLGECLTWISAEGRITADTPARLKKVLSQIGKDKPSVIFRSPGGEVQAAFRMGRMIRKAGLATSIGMTALSGCPASEPRCKAGIARKGPSSGKVQAWGGYCYSACPFVLAGGVERFAHPTDRIGVHQIKTYFKRALIRYQIEYRMVAGKKVEVSRKEISRKMLGESTSTNLDDKVRRELTKYLKDMGVDPRLIDVMLTASPDDLHMLKADEAQDYGLVTTILSPQESPASRPCSEHEKPGSQCRVEDVSVATAKAPTPAPATNPFSLDTLLTEQPAAEDPSCRFVTSAIVNTWRSPRFMFTTYDTTAAGSVIKRSQSRFIGDVTYHLANDETRWDVRERHQPVLSNQMGPTWNDCRMIGFRLAGEQRIVGYASTWRNLRNEANAEIWISSTGNKVVSIKRDALDGQQSSSLKPSLEVFDTEYSKVVEPSVTPIN